jgi:DNA polymerase-3 subunit epsilon
VDEQAYARIADDVRRALTDEPNLVLAPLLQRMHVLAAAERYEEAADVRDRAAAFAEAHRRVRRFDLVHRAGRLVVRLGRHRAVIEDGRLRHTEPADVPSLLSVATSAATAADAAPTGRPCVEPAAVDELVVLAGWLDRNAGRLEVEHCEGTLCSPLPRLPDLRGG